MHISDGIIPVKFALIADAAVIPIIFLTGRNIKSEEIPRLGVFTSALFVISLIHFPLGATSIHLCLFGLAGILFKKRAVPIIFTTLLFQTLIFQHGGLISIGINTLIMSSGSIIAYMIWKIHSLDQKIRAFLGGFTAILIPAILLSILFLFINYGKGLIFFMLLYLPSALIEAGLTLTIVFFINKIYPEMLYAVK